MPVNTTCVFFRPLGFSILIAIDKAKQKMTVSIDGVQQYEWPVSTGALAVLISRSPENLEVRGGSLARCLNFGTQRRSARHPTLR
jgi:hypothetical protein